MGYLGEVGSQVKLVDGCVVCERLLDRWKDGGIKETACHVVVCILPALSPVVPVLVLLLAGSIAAAVNINARHVVASGRLLCKVDPADWWQCVALCCNALGQPT